MPISRRTFLASGAPAALTLQAQQRRPNIVFVLSDDHSYPYLGCYGSDVRTPVLDAFARSGMRFDNMYTAAPQCVPSRAAYMTGRSPVAVRMGRFSSPLPPDVKTLPEHLRAAGYYTGVCRRNYHLDGPGPGRSGALFQRYEDMGLTTWHKRVDFLDRGGNRNQTGAIVSKFLDAVPQGRPFFLWVNFNDPHHPWDAKIPEPHDPAKLKLPRQLPDLPGTRADLARYYDEISRADEEFSQILKVLEQRSLAKETIVIFAGDNGMAFPHGKGSLYDPGLHVPLLIRWPGTIKGGSTCDQLISGEDVAPTLLEAAGAAVPAEMSGRSFLPLLRGGTGEHRKYVFGARLPHGNAPFGENTRSSTFDLSRCVRSRRYKLIYNCTPSMEYQPVDSAGDPGWKEMVAAHRARTLDPAIDQAYFGKRPVFELYDLAEDPAELRNLAGNPDLAAVEGELKRALQEKMILDYDFLPLPLNG